MKKTFARILEEQRLELEKRIASKIPSWKGLEVPSSLAFEQCSSEETARYKALLIPQGCRVADLTGGLGVDSSAFASRAEKVWYNERNVSLAEAARSNFEKLGIGNVEVHSFDIGVSDSEWLESLKAFRADVIFADPARRDSAGRKVFLLEDCSPDIVQLMPQISSLAGLVLLKLSPMADVTMLRKRLPDVKQIHIVSSKGECKELLCVCRHSDEPFRLIVADADNAVEFCDSEDISLPAKTELAVGDTVFEPSPALMKAARHEIFCSRHALELFDGVTHLYSAPGFRAPLPFCKSFAVEEILPFCGASFKILKKKYPRAEVTARGIPMSSSELASRIGCLTGSDIHIFACTRSGGRTILVCRRIS